jgi:hypothetical protein
MDGSMILGTEWARGAVDCVGGLWCSIVGTCLRRRMCREFGARYFSLHRLSFVGALAAASCLYCTCPVSLLADLAMLVVVSWYSSFLELIECGCSNGSYVTSRSLTPLSDCSTCAVFGWRWCLHSSLSDLWSGPWCIEAQIQHSLRQLWHGVFLLSLSRLVRNLVHRCTGGALTGRIWSSHLLASSTACAICFSLL